MRKNKLTIIITINKYIFISHFLFIFSLITVPPLYADVTPDQYENDDTMENAKIIPISSNNSLFQMQNYHPIQHHNFHDRGDMDWVKFYAQQNDKFQISVNNPEKKCDAVIKLFDDQANLLDNQDKGSRGEKEKLTFQLNCTGIYYLCINQYSAVVYGDDTGYDLELELMVKDKNSEILHYSPFRYNSLIYGKIQPGIETMLYSSGKGRAISFPDGSFFIPNEPGITTLYAMVDEYKPYSKCVSINTNDIIELPIFLSEISPILKIKHVYPTYGVIGSPVNVTLTGSAFNEKTTVSIHLETNTQSNYFHYSKDDFYQKKIDHVTYHNENRISFQISDLSLPGHYTLKVTNDSEVDEVHGAISFFPKEQSYHFNSKAIIVAGGGPLLGKYQWESTQFCANVAYEALINQGFYKENIRYLNAVPDIDADNNGLYDDIYGNVTLDNIKLAIEDSYKNTSEPASQLIIYFTSHGDEAGDFVLNVNENDNIETIDAITLDGFMDDLQINTTMRIIFIYDACHPGAFASELLPPEGHERIIILSAEKEETSKYLLSGTNSFSYIFWSTINFNDKLDEAFYKARDMMKGFQNSYIDADGNGIGNEKNDHIKANNIHLGRHYSSNNIPPKIQSILIDNELNGLPGMELKVVAESADNFIENVWAILIPPTNNNQAEPNIQNRLLPITLEKTKNEEYWTTDLVSFSKEGAYTLNIYTMDSKGQFSQIHQKIITQTKELPYLSKAIIVAGGPDEIPNRIWDATCLNANLAYNALLYRGYSPKNIYYLSCDTDIDSDNDGIFDIDSLATVNNLEIAIKDWSHNADELILYMIGHGDTGKFHINYDEILDAQELDLWLDELEMYLSKHVIIIYDASRSGSFLPLLTPIEGKNRIIITSNTDENVHFYYDGVLTFSFHFWNSFFETYNIYDSFNNSSDILLSYPETPQIECNGNGVGNEKIDRVIANNIIIDNTICHNLPCLSKICDDKKLFKETSTAIWAEITSNQTIQKVWAEIKHPVDDLGDNNKVIIELTKLDDLTNIYQFIYDGFRAEGKYTITIFAKDNNDNYAVPRETSVFVDKFAPYARKAIVIHSIIDDPLLESIINCAKSAYRTLIHLGLSKDNIYFLGHDINQDLDGNGLSDDVDSVVSMNNVDLTINEWAAQNPPGELYLYLVGFGNDQKFYLNYNETLDAKILDNWLDNLQMIMPGRVVFIYDSSFSGSFISPMSPPTGKQRVILTSSASDEDSIFLRKGRLSFSYMFWLSVMYSENIRTSFFQAKNIMETYQSAQIDANGNGVPNEKSDFITVNQLNTIPYIDYIFSEKTIFSSSSTLRADGIIAENSIDRVWAIIVPPMNIMDINDYVEVELHDDGQTGTYEVQYDGFSVAGEYEILFYATDIYGNYSLPKRTKTLRVVQLMDSECDINKDFQTDLKDVMFLLQTISGLSTNNLTFLDVNGDHQIGMPEAIYLLQRIAKLVSNDIMPTSKAIIVVGEYPEGILDVPIKYSARLAYRAFLMNTYKKENILFLSNDVEQDLDANGIFDDIDNDCSLQNIENALTEWSVYNHKELKDLFIYFIGISSKNGEFLLNENEKLTVNFLDEKLDSLQDLIHATIILVFEGSYSGSFIPHLMPPEGKNRTTITSCGADQYNIFMHDGHISFSVFFWNSYISKNNLYQAIMDADYKLRNIYMNQQPHVDSNGNGISNEKEDCLILKDTNVGYNIIWAH